MSTYTAAPSNLAAETLTQGHGLKLDGTIELATSINEKDFFDGLLDTVIDYIEQHDGLAVLSLNYK